MAQYWETENGEERKHGSSHPSYTTWWVSCFKANHVPMLTHPMLSSVSNNSYKGRLSADSTRTIPPNRKMLEEHCPVQNMYRPFLLSWSPKQCSTMTIFTQHWHGISYYKWSRDDLQNMESWTWGLRPVVSGTWRLRQKVVSSRPIWAVSPRQQFSRILYSNCNKKGMSLCYQPHIWTVCVSHSMCSALGSIGTKGDEDKCWPHAESIPLHIRGSRI